MTILKPRRKAQSHSAAGKVAALAAAATDVYPKWPAELVSLPTKRRDRDRAKGWFGFLLQHRTPDACQPADPARVALLARVLSSCERENHLLQERAGGDAKLAEQWRTAINGLSRQLGLSVAIRDPRLAANDAVIRQEKTDQLSFEDDLRATRPTRETQLKVRIKSPEELARNRERERERYAAMTPEQRAAERARNRTWYAALSPKARRCYIAKQRQRQARRAAMMP